MLDLELVHDLYQFDSPSDALPISLTDRSTIMTKDRFRWEFTDWNDWSWTQTCCEDPVNPVNTRTGWTKQIRPDGTARYRDDPGSPWEIYQPVSPMMVPLADVAPRWPTSEAELSALSGVEVVDPSVIKGAKKAMSDLGIDETQIVAYKLGDTVERVVFRPYNLPIVHIETDASGSLIRSLVVTGIKPAS